MRLEYVYLVYGYGDLHFILIVAVSKATNGQQRWLAKTMVTTLRACLNFSLIQSGCRATHLAVWLPRP
jgi:hypothetical protein